MFGFTAYVHTQTGIGVFGNRELQIENCSDQRPDARGQMLDAAAGNCKMKIAQIRGQMPEARCQMVLPGIAK
jgi:hypothetical protein